MKTLLCCFVLCIGAAIAQFMPQPMPMGMPGGMGGMPDGGMGGMGGMGGPGGMGGMGFNPFTGPVQSRNMDMNNNRQQGNFNNNNNGLNQHSGNDTANANDNDGHKKGPQEQPRSGTDQMLDSMGMHGIQDFYSALTNELSHNPAGNQPGGGGQAGFGDPQQQMGY